MITRKGCSTLARIWAEVLGRERVTVNGREYEATRVAQGTAAKQTLAWVVAGIPAPVKLVQRENGSDTITLRMTSWTR